MEKFLLILSFLIGCNSNSIQPKTESYNSEKTISDLDCDEILGCGFSEPDLPFERNSRIIFITSRGYPGNFILSPSNADFICNFHAQNGIAPEGVYKAWISSQTEPVNFRLENHDGPFVLLDGSVVANNFQDLLDGVINIPITITEWSFPIKSFFKCEKNGCSELKPLVWTGTNIYGEPSENCDDWNSLSFGVVGSPYRTDSGWTDLGFSAISECDNEWLLYCVQQGPLGN